MSPGFKNFNDSQNLTVVDFVSYFGQNHLFQKVGFQVPSAHVIQS